MNMNEVINENLISNIRPGDIIKIEKPKAWKGNPYRKYTYVIKLHDGAYYYLNRSKVLYISPMGLHSAAAEGRVTFIGGGDHEQL